MCMSAASDTLLSHRLHQGFSGQTDRNQVVSVLDTASPLSPLVYGVPHGWVLSPVLFLSHTRPLSAVAS